MKNKSMTYFLIVVVAGLWGYIAWRIFSSVSSNDNDAIPQTTKVEKETYNDFEIPKDTSKLLLNYRDPFGLTKQKDTTVQIHKTARSSRATALNPKPAMNWSFITYSGYIHNPSSKKLVALVSINGQSFALREGETKNQVKLIRNLRDSIKISYEGKTKFIPIKSAVL